MSNRLKNAVSPYLLQHADNPVDWYPWGDEAFAAARAADKPIFLSIGYSTCHWCHVMAHESFENHGIARALNDHFICIKVDREERPDIDTVYMNVCQTMTGSGGWPMSIFMTADKRPFYAGTYFPPATFTVLIQRIASLWHENRTELLQSAEQITAYMQREETRVQSDFADNLTVDATAYFRRSFDGEYGGFGHAPKFPAAHNLLFLLLYAKQTGNRSAVQMAEKTLKQMRLGGIFDQIGGGFSRYSTDRFFLVPHFEKMLYDNALLIMAYAAAHSLTQNPLYLETAERTADYILREMTAPDGGFYAAQDADTDGDEGKYYLLSLTEIMNVLGEERCRAFAAVFDITAEGNFAHQNIPNLLRYGEIPQDFDAERQKLYDYRKQRYTLRTDDKILLSWNALMIAAFSMLYRISHKPLYLNTAKRVRDFLLTNLTDGAQLYGVWRNGAHSETAFLDDFAFFSAGLLELYNSTLDTADLDAAMRFCDEAVRRFADADGGFTLCESGSSELFVNPQETDDNAMPCGNSIMAYVFVRLYQLTERIEYCESAERQLHFLAARAQDFPAAHTMFLLTKMLHDNPPPHIVIVPGDNGLPGIHLPFLANCVIRRESEAYPLLNRRTTYYFCSGQTCQPPRNEL